jgi:protein-S-isoprenylcysteine O-methyltransferase Ste14
LRRVSQPIVVPKPAVRWRGAIGACLLAPAVTAAVLSVPIVQPGSALDLGFDGLGWIAFVCGAGLRVWATLFIGGRKGETVVTDGPYSLCRHPLYLGSILLFVSGACFLKSPLAAVAVAMLGTAYCALTIPAEEEYLAATLGASYLEYCQRVNRIWPSWRTFDIPRRVTIDLHALYLEAARASRWVWLPLVAGVLNQVRAAAWWPQIFIAP